MSDEEILLEIVQATPEEFLLLESRIEAVSLPLHLYARGLQEYLLGEIASLGLTIAALEEFRVSLAPLFSLLLCIRLKLRRHEVEREDLEQLEAARARTKSPLILGELAFVGGMTCEALGLFEEAKRGYLAAARSYEKAGAFRKSAKSELNAISSDSHILPESKRHIANYLRVARRCRKVREPGMAGVAMNNVAAEYLRMGASGVALRYSKRAMTLLAKDYGSRHYHLALLQRAEILWGLGREAEARTDFEETGSAPFPEVIEARKIFAARFRRKQSRSPENRVDVSKLVPTWKQIHAKKGQRSRIRLGGLEQRLLAALARRPRSRHELIETLYGTQGEYSSLENRLYVLLSRVRRKLPGVLICENSSYQLADDAPLSALPGTKV